MAIPPPKSGLTVKGKQIGVNVFGAGGGGGKGLVNNCGAGGTGGNGQVVVQNTTAGWHVGVDTSINDRIAYLEESLKEHRAALQIVTKSFGLDFEELLRDVKHRMAVANKLKEE